MFPKLPRDGCQKNPSKNPLVLLTGYIFPMVEHGRSFFWGKLAIWDSRFRKQIQDHQLRHCDDPQTEWIRKPL